MTHVLRRRLPFALYPAAIIPLAGLHLWATSGVSPFAAVRGMTVAIILGVAIAAVGAALMRDRNRGGLAALLISLGVLAGGRAGIVPLVAVCLGLLLFERYGPVHLRVRWEWIGRMASRGTVIFALAVAIEVVQMGRVGDAITAFQREGPFHQPTTAQAPPEAPDVYVILLDGYARADILRDRYGITSTPLLDGLAGRGFDVASQSHSNYLITNLSLSSFLNYAPLEDVPAIQPLIDHPSDPEGPPVNRATSGAAVLDDFRDVGYETVAVASGFEQPAVRGVDRFIDTGQINEFEIQQLRPSALAPLATLIDPDVFSGQQRARIEGIFESVERLGAEDASRPKFVFAHVPSPHAPWVVHADGSPRVASDLETVYWDTPETTGLTRDEIVAAYSGQVAYLDQRTLTAIDGILANAERPPVILVISDHGSSLDVAVDNAETRLRNLVAVYTPGHPGLYPDDTTLVNLFPTLFDAYFDVELGRSPDTLFTQGPNGLFDPVPDCLEPRGAVTETTSDPVVAWWRIRLYPFAVPVAYVLARWVELGIGLGEVVRPILIGVAVMLVVSLTASAVLRDRDRGAVVALLVGLLLAAPLPPPVRIAVLVLIVAIFIERFLSRGAPWRAQALIHRAATVGCVVVVLAPILKGVENGALAVAIDSLPFSAPRVSANPPPGPDSPDVFVLLLDGYPGDDAAGVADSLGVAFDGDAFPRSLGSIGFNVQRNSRSNYLFTPQTLASMFQMRHLVDIPGYGDPSGPPKAELFNDLINDGPVLAAFGDRGYETIALSSGFAEAQLRRVDIALDSGGPTEFEIALLRDGPIGDLAAGPLSDVLSGLHRERIRLTLDQFARLATEPHDRPRFVFGHVPSPHAPWVYGSNGEEVTQPLVSFFSDVPDAATVGRTRGAERVFAQTAYVGRQTVDVLKRIVSGQRRPAIVIVFSDHGPGTGFSYLHPLDSDLDERSSNLFAWQAAQAPDLFATPTTPVNIFPMILNEIFATSFPTQPDALYVPRANFRDLVEVPEFELQPVSRDGG